MARYEWETVESDSGAENVPLLLSVRSQSIILQSMFGIEYRNNWNEVDDTTWDEIDEAVSEAYEEIMEVHTQINVPLPLAINVYLNTGQALAANVAENIVWTTLVAEYANPVSLWDTDEHEKFVVPSGEQGWYQIDGVVAFPTPSASGIRVVLVTINNTESYRVSHQSALPERVAFSYSTYLASGDIVRISVASAQAITVVAGQSSTQFSMYKLPYDYS